MRNASPVPAGSTARLRRKNKDEKGLAPVVQRLLTTVESFDDVPIGKSLRTVTGVSLLFVVGFSVKQRRTGGLTGKIYRKRDRASLRRSRDELRRNTSNPEHLAQL